MRTVTELYCLPGAASNFISYMALYNEPDKFVTGPSHGTNNEYDIWREKSAFVFINDKQLRRIKGSQEHQGLSCWNCQVDLTNSYRHFGHYDKNSTSRRKWFLDKLRHDYPEAWGMPQAFLAGKYAWVEEFIEKYKHKPGHDARKQVLQVWDEIGLYDLSMYLHSLMGFDADMDKWVTNCIKLRYMIVMKAGIDPIVITHYHPFVHFNFEVPSGIDFKTMAISINKEEDARLVDAIHNIKRPNISSNNVPASMLMNTENVKHSDTSIDYRDLFIEPKAEAIREVYKHLGNEEIFDARPNYIVSKFKTYHLINLGMLEDVKK